MRHKNCRPREKKGRKSSKKVEIKAESIGHGKENRGGGWHDVCF